ncbi:shikimate dehydrogenase [Gordonia sp. ABSL11-1]|uniref:shikimate dehydrogenase n=1 Tax=Gordonia sp. ABSL11-1 TaxID=3053924 RepID=UPI0025740811|nr:shikimate dehydrogenase [Gordonia sp. ABSL11-1]MDL9947524.1 shikimate dehydrogenase [Gordonia sp. ABSL11-1]
MSSSSPRRAAVLGSPVGHSRSPDLHRAAYQALGLTGWTYDRIECTAEQLPDLVSGLGPEYVGLSVTMPAKLAALAFADVRTDRAELVGSANTLVRTDDGWRADCTDIDGMAGALREVGADAADNPSAVVVGAGGTALPTVAALADAGITELTVVARDAGRAVPVVEVARRLGMSSIVLPFEDGTELAHRCRVSAVAVSTVPADAVTPIVGSVAQAPAVVDVIYHPWPTPLAAAVDAAGGRIVGGLVMLLNQAFSQVEQFTGRPAPREAMAAALQHHA